MRFASLGRVCLGHADTGKLSEIYRILHLSLNRSIPVAFQLAAEADWCAAPFDEPRVATTSRGIAGDFSGRSHRHGLCRVFY